MWRHLVWGFGRNAISMFHRCSSRFRNKKYKSLWELQSFHWKSIIDWWNGWIGGIRYEVAFLFFNIDFSEFSWLKAKGMKFVREMLHNTLKFPEFKVVTLEALIWRNLIWEFDMSNIFSMSNVFGKRQEWNLWEKCCIIPWSSLSLK